MAAHASHAPPSLETDLWRWLLFESGLSRTRARELILSHAQSQALSLFWQAGPEALVQQLHLGEEEKAHFLQGVAQWPQYQARWAQERTRGLQTLRINEPGYPTTLSRHLDSTNRPLLLFVRGEMALLDLPMIMPLADGEPTASSEAWALETMLELIDEGALPLLVARAGFEARFVKALLAANAPFALTIPHGLASYHPPEGLQTALSEGRALLISPFKPDWPPKQEDANPLMPHAIRFTRALAHAILALTPLKTPLFPQQPCFRNGSCQEAACDVYTGPEAFFLRLVESDLPAMPTSAPAPPTSSVEPTTPLTPDDILAILAEGGHIPDALAARIQSQLNTDS